MEAQYNLKDSRVSLNYTTENEIVIFFSFVLFKIKKKKNNQIVDFHIEQTKDWWDKRG